MLPASSSQSGVLNTVPDLTQQWIIRGADPDLVIGKRDNHGVLYAWEDLDGWFKSADMHVNVQQRGTSNRAVASSRFIRKERYITIMGRCEVETFDDLFHARERLLAAWDRPDETDAFDLIVEEPIPKRMRVRSAGPISAPWYKDAYLSFLFEIPLLAVNPTKYGLNRISGFTGPTVDGAYTYTYPYTYPKVYSASESVSTGSLLLVNEGNATTEPTITLSGPLEFGWSIENETTGQVFSLDLPVSSGQQLVIDMENHRATINDFPVQVRMQGEWLTMKPGVNRFRFRSESTDAVMTISAFSGYK